MHGVQENGFVVEGGPTYSQDKDQRSSCVVDVTTTSVSTASKNKSTFDAHEAPGVPIAAVSRAEAAKRVTTVDANVAKLNGQQYVLIGVEMDSLAVGKSARSFINRLTRQRDGQEYDADVKLLYGLWQGMWSTPTAKRYWMAAVVMAVQ